MLGKQLADFLHIYRKDTEQMRIALSSQLDAEKKRKRARLIDETKFQSLIYNLAESELEQIMSAYMKAVGSEASVYLGVSSNTNSTTSGGGGGGKGEGDVESTSNPDPIELNVTKSSASSSTVESGTVAATDDKKNFYDRKLKRRVVNENRINSTTSHGVRTRVGDEKSSSSHYQFDSHMTSTPLSRLSKSRSRSRSRSSVSSTRSNSHLTLKRLEIKLKT